MSHRPRSSPDPATSPPETTLHHLWAALRQGSPVAVDAGLEVRGKLLLRYADLARLNGTHAGVGWALLLFGLVTDVALLPRLLLFAAIASMLAWRVHLSHQLKAQLDPENPHSNRLHDALVVLSAMLWGTATWLCVDVMGSAHVHSVESVVLAALAVTGCSYIPAYPATVMVIVAGMAPAIAFMFSRGELESTVLGMSLMILAVALLTRMRLSHAILMQALRTEQENAALGNSLRDAHNAAHRDALTGLFNRRYLASLGTSLRESLHSRDEAVTLCMFDVDHFKRVNDRYGHAAGDQVLRTIAQALAGSLREPDVVARFGGEEFIAVLRHCELAQGAKAAEQLRLGVADASIVTDAGPIKVTISIGLAQWQRGESFDSVIKRADRALYAAKSAGRNRAVADAPGAPAEAAAPEPPAVTPLRSRLP